MLYESSTDNMHECRSVFRFGAVHLLPMRTTIQLHSHGNIIHIRLHHELHVTRTDLEREYVGHNGVLVRVSRKNLQENGSLKWRYVCGFVEKK